MAPACPRAAVGSLPLPPRGSSPKLQLRTLAALCLIRAAAAHLRATPSSTADIVGFSYDMMEYSSQNLPAIDCETALCMPGWLGDGECDRKCNNDACNWDHGDCDHSNDGCYSLASGGDYRGNVSVSKSNIACQYWDTQWPNTHTYTTERYPDSRLGGHNHCRNPDPEDGSTGPWCILHDNQLVWEYCDVGPPSPEPCPNPPPPIKHNHTVLQFGKWHGDSVYEHRYNYYRVHVPAGCLGVQLVVVPTSGNPDMYISFDQPFPTGHSYSYAQKGATVDVFRITRDTPGFCGELGKQSECDIYVSVAGYETARFHLIAYNLTSPNASSSCSNDCNWPDLGDGECQPQCNSSACFFDLGDCSLPQCDWDHEDCGGEGCADDCLPKSLGNGVCNEECNVESCRWDEGDCFHAHHGCYYRSDGADYRGTVNHTKSGKVCQKWSQQFPQPHTRTHANYPTAGLGGHNFCRNPDGEQAPWCYISTKNRFELCDVGQRSDSCPPPPPSRPLRGAPRPPPPPAHCHKLCESIFAHNGKCDALCNSSVCFWDHGECDALAAFAEETHIDKALLERFTAAMAGRSSHSNAMIGGAMIGVSSTASALCVLCAYRRFRRRLEARSKSKGLYMPYGNADGEMDPDRVADMQDSSL